MTNGTLCPETLRENAPPMIKRFHLNSWLTIAVVLWPLVQTLRASEPLEFSLKSATDGKTFRASDVRGKFVGLHFLLKTECPYCLKHTREYARHATANSNVVHVFIKPDSEEEIRAWAPKLGDVAAGLPIYRDPGAELAKRLALPDGYLFHGEKVHYPALVLLNPEGKEAFRYIGKSNGDRYSLSQFTEKLAELTGKKSEAISQYNLGSDRVALQGYDPVTYFLTNSARKGSPELSTKYREVTYRFSTLQNREAFLASPEKYLPAYGGWCATAMAKGEKVEIDPTNFKVTNERLFLFFKAFYANALKEWNKDEANLTAKADTHWKNISGE
jgi:thioredoxin-dependent peroxiredoxin